MVDESFDCFDTDPKGESRIRKLTENAQEEKNRPLNQYQVIGG